MEGVCGAIMRLMIGAKGRVRDMCKRVGVLGGVGRELGMMRGMVCGIRSVGGGERGGVEGRL